METLPRLEPSQVQGKPEPGTPSPNNQTGNIRRPSGPSLEPSPGPWYNRARAVALAGILARPASLIYYNDIAQAKPDNRPQPWPGRKEKERNAPALSIT